MRINRVPANVSELTQTCKTLVLTALMIMLILCIVLFTLQIGYFLISNILFTPQILLPKYLTDLFADFLLVLVGFGLLETVRAFFKDSTVHVEIVFQVAMIGVARKARLLDLNSLQPGILIGLGCIILALSIGYFLIKRIFHEDAAQEHQ